MKYLNKSKDMRQMIIKWACMNQDIKDGDSLVGKTILLNIKKINSCIFTLLRTTWLLWIVFLLAQARTPIKHMSDYLIECVTKTFCRLFCKELEMKSSKTKVLNFDEHWNGCCISSNCEEDEARFHFDAGSQYKQDDIDKLKMSNHNLSVMAAEAESYSEYWKYERDKLQKKIDDAWMWCEKGCILKAMEILKGE